MLVALVKNNMVVGIYQPVDDADYAWIAPMFEAAVDITTLYPQPQIGWYLVGSQLCSGPNGPLPIDWRITRYSMRERFQMSELLGMTEAASSDFMLQMIMNNLAVAEYIDLSSSQTQAAVGYLVEASYLTAPRAAVILGTPPLPSELAFPQGG